MSGCLMAGAVVIALAGEEFRLEWTHSVEHTAWREDWRIEEDGLRPVRAAIKGSGSGMEPGPDAQAVDGWLVWSPQVPPQKQVLLAASGMTDGAWRLCDSSKPDGACFDIGRAPGRPVTLMPCP